MLAGAETHSSRHRPLRLALAALCAVVLVGVMALAMGHGSSPKPVVLVPQATTAVICGQTITVSIVVGNDLSCPSSNGLVAGAPNITINLNGHTFAGSTSHFGVWSGLFSGVTIDNGTVSGWGYGVLADGPANKVLGIRATAGSVGIGLEKSGSSANGNVVFRNSSGFEVQGPNDKLTSNVVRENSSTGILVSNFGTGVVLQTNQSENNATAGIYDFGAGATFSGNVTNGNGSDGILSTSDPTATVTSNTANYNGAYGIEASPGGKDGGGNTAKGNATAAQCKDVVCS